MKKVLLSVLLLAPVFAYADEKPAQQQQQQKDIKDATNVEIAGAIAELQARLQAMMAELKRRDDMSPQGKKSKND